MRVLKWIVDRCNGRGKSRETAIGWMPYEGDIDIEGLENFSKEDLEKLFEIDSEAWKQEVLLQEELFFKLYQSLPKELLLQEELLISRL